MRTSCTIRVLRNSRIALLMGVLAMGLPAAKACEICGCSINGYHFGILPQFKSNFLGIRYNYRSFQSQHLISETLGILGNKSNEYYNSVELWGRFYVGNRVQMMAFIPFQHYVQNEGGTKTTAKGLGDITLAASYTLFNNVTDTSKRFKQTLQVGGGIKLPTGTFQRNADGTELNPSINTGTGSVDFLANVIYTCRLGRVGLNADVNYRINSTNGDDFRYGNRFTTAARFFYWKDLGRKTTLLPNAGILYETAGKDTHFEEKQNYSGGHVTLFTAGMEVYRGHFNIGATYQHPLNQMQSQGLVVSGDQVSVNLTYLFR